jgi:drug/metabolite transporter (DMT)-like permease
LGERPIAATLIGVLLALTSAFVWGGADFSGGFAARRDSQYQVLALSALSGLLLLGAAALFWQETFPPARGVAWAMLAGVTGGLGIAGLYRALSIAPASIIAPTAGVIGAVLPVLFGGFTQGLPMLTTQLGFGLAFAGIWTVAGGSSAATPASRRGFYLACLSGLGFGGFFISLGQVGGGLVFTPLLITRTLTLATGLLLVRLARLPLPSFAANPPALLAGLLDAGGNLFYIVALQYIRLDIAAVLASLYPASTVLLAALLLKERISPRQGLGVLICLAAVVLISI